MTGPDPEREPPSETAEKEGIGKTHEEFIGDEARPSISKQDYEEARRRQEEEKKTRPNKQP